MAVWKVASVSGEPEVVLVRWRILETDRGTRHLVGAREDDFTGRVSTAITTFDPSGAMATTSSGRVYQLRGEPAYNADAEYVWQQWCAVNGIRNSRDVTQHLLAGEQTTSADNK
jgi:hypothetical protein